MEPDPARRVSILKSSHDTSARTLLAWPGSLTGIWPPHFGAAGASPVSLADGYAAIIQKPPRRAGQVREVMRPANHPPDGPAVRGSRIITPMEAWNRDK